MQRAIIRSNIFNLTFYCWTALACVVFLPGLLLPRRYYLWIVSAWIAGCTFLEKTILNLHYEIRGVQYLPSSGSYIAACKHQSPYETIKLRVLFKDPAIVLKKELLSIPFWGWYLNKSDVIAIDRSTPDQAFASFERGALRMKDQGRPIVIFPQGTRVWVHETIDDKPYRSGVARVQASTGLPIVPMALNSGMFWPRTGWLKSSGTVVFEFLEPVPPGGEKDAVMDGLRTRVESATLKLHEEALTTRPHRNWSGVLATLFLVILFGAYSYVWFLVADQVKISYLQFMRDIGGDGREYTQPVVTGYPGPVRVDITQDTLMTKDGTLTVYNLNLKAWPLPLMPVHIQTGAIEVQTAEWKMPLVLDSLNGKVTYFNQHLTIHNSEIIKHNFTGKITGKIDLRTEPVPDVNLQAELDNYQDFLLELATLEIIEAKNVFLATAALGLFSQDGVAKIPLTQHGGDLYAGPLQVGSLPVLRRPAPGNPPAPDQ
ncbi:MAG: 1-acyl-sn-glycerol-3-phosphate acyltransferase [Alphaproteobacteria bacterium]